MSDTPHYSGHRIRLRERFRISGFQGFQAHEALELLLTYTIPRKDVKPLAKTLLDSFGGLSGVMDAPYEELAKIKGITENSATFLKAVKDAGTVYLKEKALRKRNKISSISSLLSYCQHAMSGLRDEQFRAIYLNSQNEVVADEVLHYGTVNQSAVYPRKVMERALHYNAIAMIFVHNHPSGNPTPSDEDRVLTVELAQTAKSLGMKVHDHIIISDRGHYSFMEKGLL